MVVDLPTSATVFTSQACAVSALRAELCVLLATVGPPCATDAGGMLLMSYSARPVVKDGDLRKSNTCVECVLVKNTHEAQGAHLSPRPHLGSTQAAGAADAADEPAAKRGRGRPPGSKSKPKAADAMTDGELGAAAGRNVVPYKGRGAARKAAKAAMGEGGTKAGGRGTKRAREVAKDGPKDYFDAARTSKGGKKARRASRHPPDPCAFRFPSMRFGRGTGPPEVPIGRLALRAPGSIASDTRSAARPLSTGQGDKRRGHHAQVGAGGAPAQRAGGAAGAAQRRARKPARKPSSCLATVALPGAR